MFAGVAQTWESGGATHYILLPVKQKGLDCNCLRAEIMSFGRSLYKRRTQPWALSLLLPIPHSKSSSLVRTYLNGNYPWSFTEQKVSYCLVNHVPVHICIK